MADIRIFILSTIEHYFNVNNVKINEESENSVAQFIHNPQQLHLQSFVIKENVLQVFTEIQNITHKSLVFYKTSAQVLTSENAEKLVNIVTLSEAPAESLYHELKQVYAPLLVLENDLVSSKLQQNLTDLETNLRILTHNKHDLLSFNVILSINDEIDYWKNVTQKKDASKKEREAASSFSELFEDINEEIRSLQTTAVSDIREGAENIGGLLDDVWRLTVFPYSQERMKHVLDIIGHFICSVIQKILINNNIWKVHAGTKDNEILTVLSESLRVVHTWTSACQSLTENYWPNYALHPWNGKSYVPKFCLNFEARMKEIHDIRSTHNQLNKLLSHSERRELQTDQMFEPFQNINVWICNGPNQVWETAVARFTGNIKPAEAKIAEKLKPRLHNTSTKQMLYEYMRYKTLLDRPVVKQALNSELEIFVSSLGSLLKSIQSQLDTGDAADVNMYQPPEMSATLQQVQWAKQMEAKVTDIQTISEKHLKEFEGSSEVNKLATVILKELKNMYTQLHEDWSRDLQAQVKNGALQLSHDKPVVEFSPNNNMMVVQYNPGIVSSCVVARGMAALGLPPPPPVSEALVHLSRELYHARLLHQVASFHNTMGERMIPSTRPMMLQAALDLSSLVKDQKAVYWDNQEQVANYTDKLKKAVLELESQNSYLTSQHVAIRNIVASLMDTELLAKQPEWKKKIKEIRDIIEKVETNGYNNTDLWRTHWDWQLYKALECQYLKTLMSLHKHFPVVKVDLVLRGRTVRVQPPIEEIRVQHYHQLRRFISMPAQFVGLQNTMKEGDPIFSAIVEKHSWMGNKSVAQIENTLATLERACVAWTRRAALACIPDLEELCRENLREPHDWEINFKACKAYGQAVAKMTFEDEKIEWISVGTATLRREFEAQVRNLWACLISSLQGSCREDAASIDSFIANASVALENKVLPKNAKELGEISTKQHSLKEKMPQMEKTVENFKKKGYMLRTWGGDPSVDSTIKEWQKIHELMLSHQQMFEHQAEIVKSSLSGEWDNLNTNVDAWLSRWSQTRQRVDETPGVEYNEMMGRCRLVFEAEAQWIKFAADRDDLLKECKKFSMTLNITDTWQEAERVISEDVQRWACLKEYDEEYEALAEQEWIVFQKKLHLIDELVSKWSTRLEPYTNVTLFLQQQLYKYNELTPLLKYLRGTDFTERHWREVFSLLEMDYKKPDTLQVKDLLAAALNIKKHIKALQKISSTASSESAIRTALNELELWFAGARLTVTYYTDKAKQPTPIVKDFKAIMSKIEEQQWVVSGVRGGDGDAGGDACAAWDSRLRTAHRLLRSTHHAQRRWLYLEPILSTEDGELGAKFRKVDHGFRQVARVIEADARLSALLQSARLQPMLDSISEQLAQCQAQLNQYIDEKRSIFPRLYFLSDDDLLELLGQARAGAEGREGVMQNQLKKLFPGITGVKLGPDGMSVTALCTHYGETFQLDHPVDIDCPVEVWLKNLESEMRSSMKSMALKCVVTNSLQERDPFSLPTQILCLAQNMRFTEQAERAINSKELHKLKANVEKENLYYVESEVEDENEKNKRQALILQCAYYLAVIKTLIENNVVSTSHWLWQKQLRFYLLGNREIVARMGLAQISYSYEYLGVNTGQFVRTELADECFLILTQALHLGLVGNPFGPAGTGKTESVKALGGLVGRLVLVFNCDEAMDAQCMGRLLSGLALSGAWGCFDELNRLSGATLAAVSHQFASLLVAASQRTAGATATLNGKQVAVSEWCGVAATMNPAGRGYGGRRTLPAALERVLRPVAMMQPKPEELARHLLAARAVTDAHSLAADLYRVFSMASELLSGQRHYDWGLRALKAAVGSCGAALSIAGVSKERVSQKAALRRVLRLNNLSKLTRDDADRFEAILSMVFADVPEESSSANPISSALEDTVKSLGLVHNKLQTQKCMELYEQMQQRMGVVIVGPPGSGKTTIRQILRSALTQQGKNIVEYIICPKAMSRNCLLGHIDHDTRQWTDGVISTTALEVSNQSSDVWSWVVCDGDIDPEWIEALNSVLDDNRLLTLPSGWRVQFGANVNFIFETHSLEHASPATVSRMGIILLSDDNSCAQEMLDSWIQKADIENEMAKMAIPLLQKVIKQCLQWFNVHKSDVVMKTYNICIVKQVLTQFEYISLNLGVSVIKTSPEELVYLAVQRSLMNLLKLSAVDSFQEEMSEFLGVPPIAPFQPGEWSDDVYLSPRLAHHEPPVRAVLHSHYSHLLVIGPTASAKNLLTEYILRDISTSLVITIDCTPVLEPADIIEELKRNNVVRTGMSESSRSRLVVATLFVRSLHRARVDAWGSSAIHGMLLQIIQHGGFWEQTSSTDSGRSVQWCSLQRVRVVATVDPSVARLCPRLSSALCVVALEEPDDDELLELASNYLRLSVDKNIQEKDWSAATKIMLAMYKEVSETFYLQPHYRWTASDIRKWCENVKWYSPSNAGELKMAITAEANNIFKDRLVTDSEKAKLTSIMRNYFKEHNSEGLYFAPKLRGAGVYLEAVEYKDWYQLAQKIINQCITEHEHSVFGDSGAEVCSELAVLCPAIARASNGGVVVCVGSAGVGRRAAAHVVATSLPTTLVFVNHINEFNTQFKNALSSAGNESNRTLVLINESATNNSTLGAIEALCNAGNVNALPRDMMPSLSHAQPTHQFLDNIKHNLGIIISLDKDQDNLVELLERYPILYKDSHLLWFDRWSNETLRQMPQLLIQRLIKENISDGPSDDHEAIPVEGFVNIYNSLKAEWMQAPCRYVGFIKAYYHIVNRKKAALVQRRNMLSSGVEALRRARSEVATLQAEAAEQETALSDKQAKANQALDQIGATVRAATDRKEEMHALKKNIEQENDKLQIRKKEIEVELASVEPIIAAARAAVGEIKAESLSEVRSLRAPPDVVRDVLEGVLRLMGIADTSWHSMKNFLSKRGVKEDIRCMDASQITPEAVQSVQRLLEKRGGSFEEKTAKRASAACAPLAAWVRANVAYATALARVQPLQLQQRDLMKNLHEAEDQLSALSSGLATVDERVASLKEQLGRHTRDAAAIELRLSNAANTIEAARTLLEQLAHEYSAWETDLGYISKEISELNVRSLLAAAYIVYLPDVTEPQARVYINHWSELVGFEDSTFSVINFLSTTEKQLKWDADGLPLDKSAIKNAVLIDQVLESRKCGFTPLIIDPDGDAISWLKNTLADYSCDFIPQHSDKLYTAIQYGVRLGRVLVITDVDEVHPSWAPLLLGLPLGGVAVSNASVRLLLYTRDATLPYRLPPQYRATLSLVHFTARVDGLTDQLVHHALQEQNPEVNEKAREIKLNKAALQKQQHELQENLLKDLSTNSDILHDANLLASLNKTRSSSATIAESLKMARTIEERTKMACDKFEPSAERTAILALAVKELTSHRPLVALPVDAVLEVFVDAVTNGGNNDEIVKHVTKRIVSRVLLGLHKKDKYIIVLHLLKQVYDDIIPEKLWKTFIGNNDIIEDPKNAADVKHKYPWIQNDSVRKVAALQLTFPELFEKLSLDNTDLWKEFQKSGDIKILNILKLNQFENIVAVAALRPESLYRAIVAFVDQVLGVGVMSEGGEVEAGARWGAGGRPLLLLGSHATDQLAAYAGTRNTPLRQTWIDEGPATWESALEDTRGGGWLALIVGASPFTAELRTFLAAFAQRPTADYSPEFRLWIVSEDREIPPLISNACVNIVLEAPEGMKNNVMNTLSAWGNYESQDLKLVRMHASLALLHALVQERRAYIPEGWSRWYPFEWGDVTACVKVVRTSGANDVARGLCEALYGGRVASAPDRELLSALVKDCLGEHTNAHAWRPSGTDVQLPFAKQLQAYATALSAIPSIDSPQTLALPANCRIAWENKAADNIINGLKEVSTAVSVNTKSDEVNPLKPLLALWKKWMSGSPLIKGEYHNGKIKPLVGWWGCVCAGELTEVTQAVRVVHTALARQRANTRIPLHKVPDEWQLLWSGPDVPDQYIKELCYRAHEAVKRIDAYSGDKGFFPKELDLRSFLQPRRVIAALKARTADKLGCGPDSLALTAKWDYRAGKEIQDGGVTIRGVRLCGAQWTGALSPVASDAAPTSQAPNIMLRFVQQQESLRSESQFLVPLYDSESRDELVVSTPAPLAPPFTPAQAKLNCVALAIAPV